MKCIRELKIILNEVYENGSLHVKDVNNIMLKIRQFLENESNYKNELPLVNLFCNWVVHTKLEESNTIYRFLVDISRYISKAIVLPDGDNPQETTKQFIRIAENILQIPKLREGIQTILSINNIDRFLTDKKEWWDAFVELLLREIEDKPIEFPEKVINGLNSCHRSFKFFKELKEFPHHNDWDKIVRLVIFDKDGKYHIRLESLVRAQYVVKLGGNEPKEKFAL